MDLAGVKEFEMYAVAPPFSGVVKRSLSYTKRRYNEFMNGFTSVSRNIGTFSFLCVIRKAGVPVKG
jgi:hypothetical protein